MLGLGFFCIAITGHLFPFVQINAAPTQEIDFESLLELRGKQRDNDRSDDQRDDDDQGHFGSLKSHEVAELFKKEADGFFSSSDSDGNYGNQYKSPVLNRKKRIQKVTFGHYQPKKGTGLNNNYDERNYNEKRYANNDQDEAYRQYSYNKKALEQLLSEKLTDKHSSQSRYRLVPNDLVSSLVPDADDDNRGSEYSKVYVILSPNAVDKSKNKSKLRKLLSDVLSLAQGTSNKQYREIPLNFDVVSKRTRRRDSREFSVDEEYKTKKSRNDRGRGSGGGTGGGRTAIPYIGHRADIYERD